MLLSTSDTKRKLMHQFLFKKFRRERTGFNMYAEYTQLQLTFLFISTLSYLCLFKYLWFNHLFREMDLFKLNICCFSCYLKYLNPESKSRLPILEFSGCACKRIRILAN